MNLKAIISIIVVTSSLCGGSFPADGKKVVTHHTAKGKVVEEKEEEMTAGSFMVASECESCNNGYRLDQVVFSGFDKKLRSNQESFFITNHTDRTLTAVTLYIDYLTPDGRQLNKKYYRLVCNIPPGETRKADIRTWDTQNSFYYEKSAPARGGGSPFIVHFDPIAYYLRY